MTTKADQIDRIAKIIDPEAWKAIEDGRDALPGALWDIRRGGATRKATEVLAALSVQPAAAVVGEPVAWHRCKSFMHHFVLGSERPQNNTSNPNEWTPLYAAPSAPERDAVVEPVAYASSKEWRKNHLMSAAQYKSALPKNVVDFDIPLYATLPDEALERSEQTTFDIAARLLKERDALASRISQQDAELERLRREVEEARAKFETVEEHIMDAIDEYRESIPRTKYAVHGWTTVEGMKDAVRKGIADARQAQGGEE